jgi:flagellar basal-body rod protein FlgB
MQVAGLLFDNGPLPLLKKALEASALRQRVAAANIANLETPGYVPRKVLFEELLRRPAATGGQGLPDPQVVMDEEPLDLERQILEMQEAALHYQALSQFVAGQYRALMEAIGPIR